MRSTCMIAAVALGLAMTACAKKETQTDANTAAEMNAASDTGNMAGNASAAALPAQQFADAIVPSDMFEIQSGKLAATNAGSSAVKDIAKMLVTDHTKASAEFKNAAAKTSPMVALPVALPAELKAKLAALKPLKGAEFDKLFVEQQVEGHRKALDALKPYAAGGDQASLKQFAANATPVVEGHLTKLEALPK